MLKRCGYVLGYCTSRAACPVEADGWPTRVSWSKLQDLARKCAHHAGRWGVMSDGGRGQRRERGPLPSSTKGDLL